MKKSLKAALLSGLIFPGIGHLILRKYYRGAALVVTSLVALSVVVTRAYERALHVVDRIMIGDIPMDAGSISQVVSDSASTANSLVENVAVIVLAACWLAGIIDSYRLGAAPK